MSNNVARICVSIACVRRASGGWRASVRLCDEKRSFPSDDVGDNPLERVRAYVPSYQVDDSKEKTEPRRTKAGNEQRTTGTGTNDARWRNSPHYSAVPMCSCPRDYLGRTVRELDIEGAVRGSRDAPLSSFASTART